MNNKSNLIFAVLLLAASTLGGYAARTQEAGLKSHAAKLSYRMGLQVGKILASQNIDIDPVVFLRGLRDGRLRLLPLPGGGQLHEAAMIVQDNPAERNQSERDAPQEKDL